MKIKNPENCTLGRNTCPYLTMIHGQFKADTQYRCGKSNPLFKCKIDAAIMTRVIQAREYPDCEWGKRVVRNLPKKRTAQKRGNLKTVTIKN